MDWGALRVTLALGAWTLALLLPFAVLVGRWLAVHEFRGKGLVEAALALPLVLPPTVLGYYLLVGMGSDSPLGALARGVLGRPLAFSFEGLVLASLVANLPFAVQPIQRGFEAVPPALRDAAACCGMGLLRQVVRVELPLAWPGILTGAVLTFAHTLGEFGVVLMVGGNLPGETRTVAVAIYDRVQAFDEAAAGRMSLLLLAVSLAAIAASQWTAPRAERRHG